MRIVIETTPEKIAALANELQGRRGSEPVVIPETPEERFPRTFCSSGVTSSTDN